MIDGIRQTLGEQYGLVLCDFKDSFEREANFVSRMSKETDGTICFPIADQKDGRLLEQVHALGSPIVVVDRIPNGYQGSAVISDDYEATVASVGLLASKGHSRIGFIGFHKETVSSAMARHRAFIECYSKHLGVDGEEYVRWIGREFEMNGSLLQRSILDTVFWLVKGSTQVTAIYCIQDDIALKALYACEKLGIRVPEDLEIVTVNEWPPMELMRPWDIHRIVRKKFDIGVAAAELLITQMESAKAPAEIRRIQADLIPSSLPGSATTEAKNLEIIQ